MMQKEQLDDSKIEKIIDQKVIEYQDQNDEVLDWRNNNKDRETLMNWWKYNWQLTENYLNKPCPRCGDSIDVCNKNPKTNHYELVMDDTGEIIGETERIFKDEKIGGIKGTTPTISYLAVP